MASLKSVAAVALDIAQCEFAARARVACLVRGAPQEGPAQTTFAMANAIISAPIGRVSPLQQTRRMRRVAVSMLLAAGMTGCLVLLAAQERPGLAERPDASERQSRMSRTGKSPFASAPRPSAADGSDLVRFAGGTIRVDYDPAHFILTRAELHDWVRQSARATTAYFGRFPVPYARITFEPARGDLVMQGRAVGRPEPHIVVTMGRLTRKSTLDQESLLVHEMVHLAVPDHDIRYLWLHEGIATYVENVARAQAGLVPPEEVWTELVRELPEGLPDTREAGGLDDTRSDGRRYWGGALFCLIADIEIRRATGNRTGLQDALRALQRQGGNLSRLWSLERTLDIADRGTRTDVLAGLYRQMGNRPYVPDLPRIWRDLGVRETRDGRVELDDAAPLADIRRAITSQPSPPLLVEPPRLVRVVEATKAQLPLRTGARAETTAR